MFEGFTEEALRFLAELRANNNESFYRENLDRYRRVLQRPLRLLCEEAAPVVSLIDPGLDTRPASAMSRLRRDTRFSNDKSPFRDHVWIGWRYPGERRSEGFHMYWGFGIDWYSWGCGSYGTDKPLMDMLRSEILRNPDRVRNALTPLEVGKQYQLYGEPYLRLPIPDDVPTDLAGLWRMRYFGMESITLPETRNELFSHAAAERLITELRHMTPLIQLMRDLRRASAPQLELDQKDKLLGVHRARPAEEFEF